MLVATLLPAILVLLADYPTFIQTQTLIPSTGLPTCAATCAQLQNAQTGCTPAGGAPVSNDATYQSCFCQSALLTALHQGPGAQLCTQCSSTDMQSIQTWYQGFCSNKGATNGVQSGGASSPAATNTLAQATSSIQQVQNNPTQTAGSTVQGAGSNSAGVTNADNPNNGPWFSTHWKWIVMLVVLIIGLTAFAVIFSIFHRRYHRRREQQWSQATVPHPNINTWGPGQSVHDIGGWNNLKRSLSRSLSRNKGNKASNAEKGKTVGRGREAAYSAPPVPPPPPAMTQQSQGTGFGARQPPSRNGRMSRGHSSGMI